MDGVIATNTVQGKALAYVENSTLRTTDTTIDSGNVTVAARNVATIDAGLVNSVNGGSKGVAVTLAFNSIGWEPQNVLFNLLDTILGDPLIADEGFDGDGQSNAVAYLVDTTVSATGALAITAGSAATLRADIDNRSTTSSAPIRLCPLRGYPMNMQ